MAEIVHLGPARRQRKKAAARAEKDAKAAENRTRHGRTKAERVRDRAAKADAERKAQTLDGHRRGRVRDPETP